MDAGEIVLGCACILGYVGKAAKKLVNFGLTYSIRPLFVQPSDKEYL